MGIEFRPDHVPHMAEPAWLLIGVACAECRGGFDDDALVTIHGAYPTAEAAKDAYDNLRSLRTPEKWLPHPHGGEYVPRSDGDVWVAPVTAFTDPKITEDDPDA